MAEETVHLELPLLLPEVKDERDQCVARLLEVLDRRRGIEQAHVERTGGESLLCVHYDANLVGLAQVQRWAEQAGADVSRRYRHETFRLTGMDCPDCSLSIEHIMGRLAGILAVAVNYAAEKMWVEYDSTLLDRAAIVKRVASLGYAVEEEEQARGWIGQNWELVLSLASGLFLATGFLGETFFGLPHTAAIAFYVLAYAAGGYDVSRHALKGALNLRFDIDFLMVVAALGAAFLGHWAEGALLLFLFSLGHSLEHYAMGRARHAIQALGEITPKTARARREDRETELPVEELLRGDVVVVRPGERVPIDGRVLEGCSAVDQSPITGESVPVEKGPGDELFAGTVNGGGTLVLEVTRLARDTTLARVIQMVEEAQAQKSPTQQFTDRFGRVFVPVVLVGVVLVIVVPPLLGWLPWQESLLRGMTILVAASPCALALATPSAVLAGIGQAARYGVLIKGGVHLENLGALEAIALDKTGTLTRGEPEVTTVISLDGTSERELLRVAAAVESRSSHPLAQAIVRYAGAQGLDDLPRAGAVQALTGRGVRGELDGQVALIGNLRLFEVEGTQAVPGEVASHVGALEAEGKTTMVVQHGERFLGIIGLADQPRDTARSALERLRLMGIRTLVMLTGDNERVAAAIAESVGLTDYAADLLPDGKLTAIQDLMDRYGRVAMVGDGVNDAPALARSTVGIAMGAGGSDVALETADVALMADDLSGLPFAVGLSRQARRIIRQNVAISLGAIALLVPIALFGLAGIGPAIILHEGSTLVVVANALRLLGYRRS
ncbi:heavy metal translocating P-type ATPase [Chloroflexota bacterium]